MPDMLDYYEEVLILRKMCKKYGKEEVDKNWSFEECLEVWVTIH